MYIRLRPICPEFSDASYNLLMGLCVRIGNFIEILFLVIILNIITDRDKL